MDERPSHPRGKALALGLILSAISSPAANAWQPIDIKDESALRSPPQIVVRNGTLYFDGVIIAGTAAEFQRQLNMRRVNKISVNSSGGDVQEAIAIAEEIHKRELDIEVRTLCASTCANYLFPAAKNKFLSQYALLLWHGSLHSPAGEFTSNYVNAGANASVVTSRFTDLKQQEDAFYQRIHVDGRFAWCPQAQSDYARRFPEKWFSWSQASLSRFGVNNIFFTTSAARWQKAVADKGVIFAEYCQ